MAVHGIYEPRYVDSWSLCIGINSYQYASPLSFACNDARAIALALSQSFGFKKDNVRVLTDEEATKKNILAEFSRFTLQNIGSNDRLVVFFAGHGVTRTGSRGEVGFLVPSDGDVDDVNS